MGTQGQKNLCLAYLGCLALVYVQLQGTRVQEGVGCTDFWYFLFASKSGCSDSKPSLVLAFGDQRLQNPSVKGGMVVQTQDSGGVP